MKASKASMETQQNELLLNNLENKLIEKVHMQQQNNYDKQIEQYKKEIYLN